MRNLIGAGALAAAAFFVASTAHAQTIACGGAYVVKRGDTLQRITNAVYGQGQSYQFLYNANRAVIGPNPSLIEVGMRIDIPCRDGAAPAGATAAAATPAPAPQQTAATPVAAPVSAPTDSVMMNRLPFRFVTGTDWAPFTDHRQAQGGMVTDIMRTALSSVLTDDQFRIDTVRDWSAHIDPLLTDVAYDFSLPWFKPNCDLIDKLGDDARRRCEGLKFSDPLFEMITGYYGNAADPNLPRSYEDLVGKRICRAEGYATFMLEEFDIRPPAIEYVRPTLWAECFEMLAAGEVDVLYISTTAADDVIAELGLSGQVVEIPELAYVTTMHAITSVNNARADEQLAVVNAGIKSVREDGTWFNIVQRHLIAHTRKTANN